MAQKKYRVAVIGRTGKGGYGHGLDVVWKEIDNVENVAVADPDDKGRAAAAKKQVDGRMAGTPSLWGPRLVSSALGRAGGVKRGRGRLA